MLATGLHAGDARQLLADGTAAAKRGDMQQALALFSQAVEASPNDAQPLLKRAETYMAQKEYAAGIADCDQIIHRNLAPPSAAYLLRAYGHAGLKQFEQAEADCNQAVTLAPQLWQAFEARAQIYRTENKWDLAIQDCDEIIRRKPHYVEALYSRGCAYAGKNAPAEAMEDFDEAILVDASRADTYRARANAWLALGDFDRALLDFEQALRLNPNGAGEANALAWLLATCPKAELRNPARAVSIANQACLKYPNSSSFIDTQAAAFAAAGDYDLAIKSQEFALKQAAPEHLAAMKERLASYHEHKPYVAPAFDEAKIHWDRLRFATFDLVWRTVNEQYFDADASGPHWREVRDKYRLAVSEVKDDAGMRVALQSMLGEIHRSHFAIIPRSAAVFSIEERVRQGTSGVRLAVVGSDLYILHVDPQSAAADVHLNPGDQLVSFEGQNLDSIHKSLLAGGLSSTRAALYIKEGIEARLSGPVGSSVHFTLVDTEKNKKEVTIHPKAFDGIWSEPVGNFPSEPIQIETLRDNEIAYARYNVFALPVIKPLKKFLRSLQPTDGLIIDLRGNPGGALLIAPGLSGWLLKGECTLGSIQTRNDNVALQVFPQRNAFSGPIAILVDGSSASTSEVFAAGMRDLHRARIFGSNTAGAALPSVYIQLPNGDLFQYAVGDIHTVSGNSLEGEGVQPDVQVAFTRSDLVEQHDPVIDAAKHWLRETLTHNPARATAAR